MNGYQEDDATVSHGVIADAAWDTTPARQAINTVDGSDDPLVEGLLTGLAWRGGRISYSFPDSRNDYQYGGEKNDRFGEVDASIRNAVRFTLDKAAGGKANDGFAVEGFTKLTVTTGGDRGVTLRFAESGVADPTAYGYYPNRSYIGGDVWFGARANYSNAVAGNYQNATVVHEIGHALGLKHSHESERGFPAIPKRYDSLEYTVMTYKSFVGDDAASYKNEHWGYPQSFMMADIAALQHMYGANYGVNDNNTTYSWRPGSGNTYVNGKVAIDPGANRIFATIWDGGGNDTYDLSAYDAGVTVDLRPGSHSLFRRSQLVDLGAQNKPDSELARGNIFNALLHDDDERSLIENAIGGAGNDKLSGNIGPNHLFGRGGNDRLSGWRGADMLEGGGGRDIFVFQPRWDDDTIVDFRQADKINLRTFGFDAAKDVIALAANDGKDVVLTFNASDSLRIENTQKDDLGAGDFLL